MGSRHDTFANSLKAVLQGFAQHAAPPDKLWTPVGIGLWFAACSAGWHYLLCAHFRDKGEVMQKLGWGWPGIKRRVGIAFALFVFCVICWVFGNTMSGMGV
jgi:hypothetical protein